jgi:hypothetical protein
LPCLKNGRRNLRESLTTLLGFSYRLDRFDPVELILGREGKMPRRPEPKGTKMSKMNPVGYENVPARAESLASYILAEHPEIDADVADLGIVEVLPKLVAAFFAHHGEWQRQRNLPGGEADQEREARKAEQAIEAGKKLLAREDKLREQLAEIEAAKKAAKAS